MGRMVVVAVVVVVIVVVHELKNRILLATLPATPRVSAHEYVYTPSHNMMGSK